VAFWWDAQAVRCWADLLGVDYAVLLQRAGQG
jgi:hypothetical protein